MHLTIGKHTDDSPIVFLRIAWMRFYEGLSAGDQMHGGGSFVEQNKFGHEMFNFLPFDNSVFGYVRPTSGGTGANFIDGAGIKVERIGGGKGGSELPGVLVVWVASPPGPKRQVIVGWYRDATIYRSAQPPPPNSNRFFNGEGFGYYVRAEASNATRLSPSARIFRVQQHEKGWMGQSNVWYADDPDRLEFRSQVRRYIADRTLPTNSGGGGNPRQPDPLLRAKIEIAAIEVTTAHFEGQGYAVRGQEKDNLGWDLLATFGTSELKLEVKGLSGDEICVELTPNEYKQMRAHSGSYYLCVVTTALNSPRLTVFAYSTESGRWQDDDKRTLSFNVSESARCTVQ